MGDAATGLVLIGHRRSGKSTVGRHLAESLNWRLVDLDRAITEATGRTPEAWIHEEGEPAFRTAELRTLTAITQEPGPTVLATGGGTPFLPGASSLFQKVGPVVWLQLPFAVLAARIQAGDGRPLLMGQDPKEDLLLQFAEREPGYRRMADHVVPGSGEPPVIAARCRQLLRESDSD